MDTELRDTSRSGEAEFTPAYQASITVSSRQKARIATAIPNMVRPVRSFCLNAFRATSLKNRI